MGKTKTITINKGGVKVVYAKVVDRVGEFHKAFPSGMIKTEYDFKNDFVCFKAYILPDYTKPERYFTGTSMGKIGTEKALEKIETLAVGRALAFAGFLADGEIASAEEIQKYNDTEVVVDVDGAIEKLTNSKTLEELKNNWKALTADERNNTEVAFAKEEMKIQLDESVQG